jgi:nucleoside-diphosphate-sugar epimerase
MAMKALVIGGTGPTGPYILEGLVKRGYDTTIYHRGIHEVELHSSVKHIHGDPFSSDLERDLGGLLFDLVISNYGRLRCNAGLLAGKCERFIGVTGGPVYLGWMNTAQTKTGFFETPCSETAALNHDVNQEKMGTRIAHGEQVVMEKHSLGAFKATIMRYPLIYGPHQLRSNVWPIVQRIIDGREQIIVPGDGLQLQSLGYAANCAHAILLAVDNPKAIGEIYNVADEKCYSLYDFIKLIATAMGAKVELIAINHPKAFEITRGYARAPQHRMFDISKITNELSYKDIVPTPEAVKLYVEWSLNHRDEERKLAMVLDDPRAYDLEDELIIRWKDMMQHISNTPPSVPPKKDIKYEYGNSSH